MKLIVGLGNPGEEYAKTRHNVGFWAIDALAEKTKVEMSTGSLLLKSLWGTSNMCSDGQGRWRGQEFILLKPLTYMNRSGAVVAKWVKKYQIKPEDILVVYDDLNLPVGGFRIRPQGGAGGHNGLQDIIDELETDEFPRIRLGIGNDFEKGQQANFVLSEFNAPELEEMQDLIKHAVSASLAFVQHDLQFAMNHFNKRKVKSIGNS